MLTADKLTLGQVIAKLRAYDPNHVVPVGFGEPASWRGDYSELAFEPVTNTTAGAMLGHAVLALGKTFEAYKGGLYRMDENTPVNVACWGAYHDEDDYLTEARLAQMLGETESAGEVAIKAMEKLERLLRAGWRPYAFLAKGEAVSVTWESVEHLHLVPSEGKTLAEAIRNAPEPPQ